jgi:predicted nucleic-acid-binding protein
MYKGIIDTNVLLRFLIADSKAEKEKFKKLLKETSSEKKRLLVPLMVVIELAYVLEKVYKLPKNEVRENIESLEALHSIEVESDDIVLEALRLYAEENLKFGDAMILAKSRTSGIRPVYSFDKKDFKKYPDVHLM